MATRARASSAAARSAGEGSDSIGMPPFAVLVPRVVVVVFVVVVVLLLPFALPFTLTVPLGVEVVLLAAA